MGYGSLLRPLWGTPLPPLFWVKVFLLLDLSDWESHKFLIA